MAAYTAPSALVKKEAIASKLEQKAPTKLAHAAGAIPVAIAFIAGCNCIETVEAPQRIRW